MVEQNGNLYLENLVGRRELKDSLLRLVQTGNNVSLLLQGEEGLGKHTVARALAEILLCRQPCNNYACHKCASCNYFHAQSHPDYVELTLQAGQKQITMEQLRNFTDEQVNLQPLLGGRRVFLLELYAVSPQAQNLLLKTLESGAAGNFYILLANNLTQVLPTVQSRTQIFNLPHLSQEDLQQFTATLPADGCQDAAELKRLAEFSQGNPGFYLQLLHDEAFLRYYNDLQEIFRRALKCSPALLLSEILTELGAYKDKDKQPYLWRIWSFFLYKTSLRRPSCRPVFIAWQKCVARLQANGSFEIQMQAFLPELAKVL